MNAIVAVDKNWGIGRNNGLLAHIPEDMRFFRQMTLGKTVILGRKTLQSFPGGQPLKDREHLVLSRRGDFPYADQVRVFADLASLLRAAAERDPESLMVIGGAQVYWQLLPYCARAYVTMIDAAYPADAHFPDLSADSRWVLTEQGERMEHEGVFYRHCIFENQEIKA